MEDAPSRRLGTRTVMRAMHPGVVACAADASGATVAWLMARYGVHAIAVVEGRDPQAWHVIDDLALLRASRQAPLDRLVASAIEAPLPAIESGETVERAADVIAETGSRHLLVLDCDTGHPIAILSTLDVVAALAETEPVTVHGASP